MGTLEREKIQKTKPMRKKKTLGCIHNKRSQKCQGLNVL